MNSTSPSGLKASYIIGTFDQNDRPLEIDQLSRIPSQEFASPNAYNQNQKNSIAFTFVKSNFEGIANTYHSNSLSNSTISKTGSFSESVFKEIFLSIFTLLKRADLRMVACVSKKWNEISKEMQVNQFSRDAFFSELPSRNLSDLLPYVEKNVRKALLEYSLLLKALKQTIKALESHELDKFDALVGENLCQIRATIIPLIFQNCLESFIYIKAHVENILEKVEKLLVLPIEYFYNFSLKTLLESKSLEICLSASEILFVEFYLLTIVKKRSDNFDRPEVTHRPYLRLLAPVCDNFTEGLIKKIKKEVSKISAPFLRSLAFEYGDKMSFEMLAQKNIALIQGRECPPTFWTTKVMMQAMLIHRIPIVLWIQQKNEHHKLIKEFCVYYESDSSKTSFIIKSPFLIDKAKPVIVVQSISHRKREKNIPSKEISFCEIEEFNLTDYLLAHGASHRQYPNQVEDICVENTHDHSYHDYKKKAIEWKCTREDPQLFYIYHIYCDRLGNVKPIKYELDLEAKYGNFYRRIECAKLKDLAEKLNVEIDVVTKGRKIVVSFINKGDFWNTDFDNHITDLNNQITFLQNLMNTEYPNQLLHLMTINQILKECDITIDEYNIDFNNFPPQEEVKTNIIQSFVYNKVNLELEPNWEIFDPVALAIHHPNPIQFFIDHRSHWLWDFTAAEFFLTAKPKDLIESDALDTLSDLLQDDPLSNEYNLDQLKSVIVGISKTLDIPELQERAIELLIWAGSQYESSFDIREHWDLHFEDNRYYIIMRSYARKALINLVDEHPQIEIVVREMLEREPVVQLKMELLNMLEYFDKIAEKLEDQIIKNLYSTWDLFTLTPKSSIENLEDFIVEEKQTRNIAVHELLQLIQSEEQAKHFAATIQVDYNALRIVAIRYLSNYFITLTEDYMMLFPMHRLLSEDSSINSPIHYELQYIQEQQNYRRIISESLIKLARDENFDLREEASSLLTMIVAHLECIKEIDHPTHEIREEVPILLGWISLHQTNNIT